MKPKRIKILEWLASQAAPAVGVLVEDALDDFQKSVEIGTVVVLEA